MNDINMDVRSWLWTMDNGQWSCWWTRTRTYRWTWARYSQLTGTWPCRLYMNLLVDKKVTTSIDNGHELVSEQEHELVGGQEHELIDGQEHKHIDRHVQETVNWQEHDLVDWQWTWTCWWTIRWTCWWTKAKTCRWTIGQELVDWHG